MARIYSAVLGTIVSSAPVVASILGTVPNGQVWVIRSLIAFVPSTFSAGTLAHTVKRGTTTYFYALDTATGAGNYISLDLRIVLEAGDQIQEVAALTGTGSWRAWVSGYRLVALP